MLYVGSTALKVVGLLQEGRKIGDTDIICTFEQFKFFVKEMSTYSTIIKSVPMNGGKKWHVRVSSGWNYEFEFAHEGNTGYELLKRHGLLEVDKTDIIDRLIHTATPAECLMLKLSHRYLRNSPHFKKTMDDIHWLREHRVELDEELKAILVKREAETYTYKHPALNVSKEDFFNGDGVNYIYDHDSIHLTQALIYEHSSLHSWPVPAYTYYMQDGAQVNTSKEKFFEVPEQIRLYGVYEETCVLALERSQIPSNFEADPQKSFMLALEKVCTSITSGWFREYAWENYQKVVDLYEEKGEDDYLKRFNANKHLLKPYKGDYK